MATDALMTVVQASVTKTATFNGASVDLLTRLPTTTHLAVRVLYSAATNASGSNSVTFTVDGSTDNSNWGTISGGRVGDVVNLSTTAQAGEIFLLLEGSYVRYIRLTATFAGAGSTPTITYQGDVVMAGPA